MWECVAGGLYLRTGVVAATCRQIQDDEEPRISARPLDCPIRGPAPTILPQSAERIGKAQTPSARP